MREIKELFNKPKIISIIGDINTGKSNLIHAILRELKQKNTFNLYTYGFKAEPDTKHTKIHSVDELEQITNSIIAIDEVMSLFDLNNRMAKRTIENTLRLLHHNNNILILLMLPENTKKFLSGKINVHMFKKSTIADFINGSRTKNILTNYHGDCMGSKVLNLTPGEVLIYDNMHYYTMSVPYVESKDLKRNNVVIVRENVNDSVNDNVLKT